LLRQTSILTYTANTKIQLLTPFLPSLATDATEEYHMLRLSFLIDRITDLIRNDSISDITDRIDLYSVS
jgi:baculoviral IAP repeat-containing protein 6